MEKSERYGRKKLAPQELLRALETPDLTEPSYSDHGIGVLYSKIKSVASNLNIDNTIVSRQPPVVSIFQHYDELLFTEEAGVRSDVNSKYIDNKYMLRGHTAANIPPLLKEFANSDQSEVLLVTPGICFRSTKTDMLHASVIHQVDLWYLTKNTSLDEDLMLQFAADMATRCARELVPDHTLSMHSIKNQQKSHPYLHSARKIKASDTEKSEPLTLLEYGTISPSLLSNFNLNNTTGISIGIILERALMLRKNLPDVRLIASNNESVRSQMYDLTTYQDHEKKYPYSRDLSLVLPEDTIDTICSNAEHYILNQFKMRSAVNIKSVARADDLPPHVQERLGINDDQVNILLGISFNSERPLHRADVNKIRDSLHDYLNQ